MQGISKKNLIDKHKKLLTRIIESRNYTPTKEKIEFLAGFSENMCKVLMFGVQDIAEIDLSYKTELLSNFSSDYEGLVKEIKKTPHNRNIKAFPDFILEKFKFSEQFFIRALEEIDFTKTEKDFIEIIDQLEEFLANYWKEVLLVLLLAIENETKQYLEDLYNQTDKTPAERITEAENYFEAKQKELVEKFAGDVQNKMNNEAIKNALLVAGILNLPKPEQKIIEQKLEATKFDYLSNIKGYWFNTFRRATEQMATNLFGGLDKRSQATEQLKTMSFNQRDFELSVITHPRALFRSLVLSLKPASKYKMFVPSFVYPNLNPSGMTKQYVYQTKTLDEWNKINVKTNINVVGGLGIHHGSQDYYLPIYD